MLIFHLNTQGKAKKTRKFAAVKRILNPNDARLYALLPRLLHVIGAEKVPQERKPTEAEEKGRGREGKSRPQSVNTHPVWSYLINS